MKKTDLEAISSDHEANHATTGTPYSSSHPDNEAHHIVEGKGGLEQVIDKVVVHGTNIQLDGYMQNRASKRVILHKMVMKDR